MSTPKASTYCPIKITSLALEEIKNILDSKKIPAEYGLRVGINGGGCSGISYFIGFDTEKEKDDVFLFNDIILFIEKKHSMFLWGVEVGFVDSGVERGFIFNVEK